MSSSKTVNVKAYLEKGASQPAEIRRFCLDEDVSTSYIYFTTKLASLFPTLDAENVRVCWKDEEGDFISISSDEELVQAYMYGAQDGLLKIYLHPQPQHGNSSAEPGFCTSNSANVEHPGIVCDGCNINIRGLRYKCLVCSDFDLCGSCCEKGIHNHHYMLRMATPAADYMGQGCPAGRPHPWWNRAGGFGGFGGGWPGAGNMRRMWRQFMRNQGGTCQPGCGVPPPAAAAAAAAATAAEAGQHADSAAENTAAERDYLQHVGEQVSAFLEPLGIAVDVDVEERGPNGEKIGKGKKSGRCGRRGDCSRSETGSKCCKKAEKSGSSEGASTSSEVTTSELTGQTDYSQQDKSAAGSAAKADESPERHETPMDSSGDETSWIKIEPKDGDSDVVVIDPPAAPEPSAPQEGNSAAAEGGATASASQPIYPILDADVPAVKPKTSPPPPPQPQQQPPLNDMDTKVMQAVAQMRAMGFHDEGGWMTSLLYSNNGDLYKVIDTVLRSAQTKRE